MTEDREQYLARLQVQFGGAPTRKQPEKKWAPRRKPMPPLPPKPAGLPHYNGGPWSKPEWRECGTECPEHGWQVGA